MKKMKLSSDKIEKPKKTGKNRKLKLILLIAGSVLLLCVIAFLIWNAFFKTESKDNDDSDIKSPEVIEPVKYYSPLTGREISSPDLAKRPVITVMIENSPEARPQSGLKDAGVVFEAIAEGGITRFAALYQESDASLIGPVRSVRPYYLEWAAAFDPAVAHVGGSQKALNMATSGQYGVDLDQFYNDSAYWRAKDRRAPHNVYTDMQHLLDLAKTKGKTSSNFTGWTRQDGKPADCTPCAENEKCDPCAESATNISLELSYSAYNVSYIWDKETNTYKRSVAGKPHEDREKGQISPDVVIALRSNYSQDGIYSVYQTTGSGDCYVFQNGTVIEGKWSRSSDKEMLKFTDKNGEEIKLNVGQTWITAVGQNKKVSWN